MVKKVTSPVTAPQASLLVVKVSEALNEVVGALEVETTTEVDENASSAVVKAILLGKSSRPMTRVASDKLYSDCTSAGGNAGPASGGYGGSWSRGGGGGGGGQTCYVSIPKLRPNLD